MANTPELRENPLAKILPVLWVGISILTLLILGLVVTFGQFQKQPLTPIFDSLRRLYTPDNQDTPSSPYLSPAANPTRLPTPTFIPTVTVTPTRVVVSCLRVNIREGEFASHKCYQPADRSDLLYYLQRFDSAAFDLRAANNTIDITCNCRVPTECEFFKNSCQQAREAKAAAEASLTLYRQKINALAARGK